MVRSDGLPEIKQGPAYVSIPPCASGDIDPPIGYISARQDKCQTTLNLSISWDFVVDHIHMRDNYRNPLSTESITLFSQADPILLTPNRRVFDAEYPAWPSLSPPTTSFQYTDEAQPSSRRLRHPNLTGLTFEALRPKALFRGFEKPSFVHITVLIVLCLTAYPALYILTLVANDKSLTVVRLIVALWCSAVGFALGYILLKIGMQHFEAASELAPALRCRHLSKIALYIAWATVIHMSYEGGGIKFHDLARISRNPTNFLPALRILLSRLGNREMARNSRRSYEFVFRSSPVPHNLIFLYSCSKRPWSLFLGLFIVLAVLVPMLPFLFGRIMVIETYVRVRVTDLPPSRASLTSEQNQRNVYREVLIAGDLSQEDVDRAASQLGAFQVSRR